MIKTIIFVLSFGISIGLLTVGCSSKKPVPVSEKDTLEEDVRPHKKAMRECYESQLDGGTAPKDFRIVFTFFINDSGKIERLRETTALPPNWKLQKCLLDEFKGVRFHDPRTYNKEVNYPMNYSSRP